MCIKLSGFKICKLRYIRPVFNLFIKYKISKISHINDVVEYGIDFAIFVVSLFYFNIKIWPKCFDSFRSEEHTSELQSHSDLVCRLLLEKKKKLKSAKKKQRRKEKRVLSLGVKDQQLRSSTRVVCQMKRVHKDGPSGIRL